jgi:hypothetical protein
MDGVEFLLSEYATLREEIKETKARMFKLAVLGIIGVPSAGSIARDYKLEEIILSLPFLICAFVLLYLSENLALMRCGKYIKEVIEPKIRDEQNLVGWEHWLEDTAQDKYDRRRVDKYVAYFFYIIFGTYYILTAVLAVQIKGEWRISEHAIGIVVFNRGNRRCRLRHVKY